MIGETTRLPQYKCSCHNRGKDIIYNKYVYVFPNTSELW